MSILLVLFCDKERDKSEEVGFAFNVLVSFYNGFPIIMLFGKVLYSKEILKSNIC